MGRSVGIFSGEKATLYRIKLTKNASRWLQEDPWHAQQTIEPQTDGSSVLTVPTYHPMEIIPRVLALGAEAEIIEPAEGREEIRNLVKELAGKYKG